MNNNVVVKILVHKDFFGDRFLNKNLIEVKTKYTNKKRANGLVIPLSNEIVLDENGEDFIFSLVGFWYEDECDYGIKDASFIVKLNNIQFNELSNIISELNKADRHMKRESDFNVLCRLFGSVYWFSTIKKLLNKGYEYSKFSNFNDLGSANIHGIYGYLTKVDK